MSGELLFSLVGAVNFYHGKDKAEQFITEKLVDQFEKSVLKMSEIELTE